MKKGGGRDVKALFVTSLKGGHGGLDLNMRHIIRGYLDAGTEVHVISRGKFDMGEHRSFTMKYTPANIISWLPSRYYYGAQSRIASFRAGMIARAHEAAGEAYDHIVGWNMDLCGLGFVGRAGVMTWAPNLHHSATPHSFGRKSWPALDRVEFDALYRRSRRIICIAHRTRETFGEAGVEAGKIDVIQGGVDSEKFTVADRKAHLGEENFKLLFMGKYSHRKGVVQILKAWKASECRGELILLGNASKEMETEVLENMSDNVRRIPFQKSYLDLLAGCHAQILLSEDEGMPKALLEGAAAGLATIATKNSGYPVGLAGNGFVVDRDKPGEIARAILELARNPEHCARMGWSGSEYVRGNFDWKVFRERLACWVGEFAKVGHGGEVEA